MELFEKMKTRDFSNLNIYDQIKEIQGYELSKGENIVIITSGPLLYRLIKVKEKLLKDGINPSIIIFPYVNPIEENIIDSILNKFEYFFIIEESLFPSPIYSKFLKVYSEKSNNKIKTIKGIYIPDKIIQHATRDEQLDMAGFSVDNITNIIYTTLNSYDKFQDGEPG